jgi:hypothetical protein
MTAEEIREYMDEHLKKGTLPDRQVRLVGLRLLSELAAQLAELNLNIRGVRERLMDLAWKGNL